MQVTVKCSSVEDRHRLLITVKEEDHDDVVFYKNLKELIDFIELLAFEIRRVSIPLSRNVSEMSYSDFGELLTSVINHRQLGKLLKVKGFFLNVGKAKMKLSKTIGSDGRRTNSTKASRGSKKPVETISTIVQLEDVKELERSYMDINNPELKTYLQGLGYTDIAGLGNGTSKAVFRAKNTKGEFVAVKVGKLEQSAKMRQENKITNSVGQKMSRALFGGFLQIYKIFTDNANNLIVIEEELASKTLRDIILEKRQKGEIFTYEQLTKIIQDLVESLYHMHVQNQVVHRDIKPQNIFYTEHRYTFGDYGEAEQKYVNILDKKIKMRMNELKGTPMYMETKLLRLCNRNRLDTQLTTSAILTETQVLRIKEIALDYDPFKADVYSLGLVLFELVLHNAGYTLDDQIETLFYWQRGERLFDDLVKSFDLRSKQEKYILLGGKLLVVPSLLERMLDENESQRISTFELSLLSTHKSTILSNILTPFTDIFLPNCFPREDNNYQVDYNYKMMTYVGGYCNGQRQGEGIMYRKNQSMIISTIMEKSSELEEDSDDEKRNPAENEKSASRKDLENMHWQYKGIWRNDLPNKIGILRLNDSDNRYSGEFAGGMFDGDGEVYFKDKLMYKAKWKSNYNDHILQPAENFKTGTYRFREVCQESSTIYGFVEESEEPVKRFIIEIDVTMKLEVKNVLSQVVRVLSKSAITSVTLLRNSLFHYHELVMDTDQERIVIVVRFDQQLATWFLQLVFASFTLDSLRSVNLELNDLESDPVEALSKRLDCFNLIDINLADCYFVSEAALNKLLSSSMVNRLLKLNLSATQTSNRTMKMLSETTYLTKLREMNLSYCRFFNNVGLQVWLTSKNARQLELLDIGHTYLEKGLVLSFQSDNHLKKLRRLRVENVGLSLEEISEICGGQILAGVTELHCGALWLRCIEKLEKLRTLHLCGSERFERRRLFNFLVGWKHNKLDVLVSPEFIEKDTQFRSCREALRTHFEGAVSRLVLPCFERGLKIVTDVVTESILRVEILKKKEVDEFSGKLDEMRHRGWQLKELVVRHSAGFKDCFEKLLKCDFKGVVIERLTVSGYFEEEAELTTKQGMEASKQKILQLSALIKEAVAIIHPKEINIPEIFQRESLIGLQLQERVGDVENVRINGSLSSTKKIFKNTYQPLPICKASSNATLDETLHALAASECLGHLTQLNLRGRTNVTDRGISYIINSKHCRKISGLDLSNTCISSNVFLMLKSSDNMQLKSLCANNLPNSLNFEDVESYVLSGNSHQLKRFQLKNCNLNQLDLFFLQLNLENLEEIDINFGGSLTSNIDYLDRLIATAKYDKLKRIYLDLSKCPANRYLQFILRVFSSPKITKMKLNLASLETNEELSDEMVSQEIFVRNLNKEKKYEFIELNLNFSRTNIFKSHFFEFLANQRVRHLRLAFTLRFDNENAIQLRDSLALTYSSLNTFELNLDKCTEINNEEASRALADIFRRLENVDALMLNFSLCRQLQKWNVVLEGLQELKRVRTLQINLASCRITDEIDILCEWITGRLQKGQKRVSLSLDLTNCWHLQRNDRCFVNILRLIEQTSRFSGKIKLYMKNIRLPPIIKNRLTSLSKKPEYDLQFEQ